MAAIHIIALTQAHCHDDARAFLSRRKANGDGGMEALRILKRRLSDVVYRAMLADRPLMGAAPQPDKACRGRLWIRRRLAQGLAVRMADRHHLLRLCMLTMTRNEFRQVRCAVFALWSERVHATRSKPTREQRT